MKKAIIITIGLLGLLGGCATPARAPAKAAQPSPRYERFDSLELRALEPSPSIVDLYLELDATPDHDHEEPCMAYPMEEASLGHRLDMGFGSAPATE